VRFPSPLARFRSTHRAPPSGFCSATHPAGTTAALVSHVLFLAKSVRTVESATRHRRPIRLGSAAPRIVLRREQESPGRHCPDIPCHQARLTKGEDHQVQGRTGLGLRENAPREGYASRETGCLRRAANRAMGNDLFRSVQPGRRPIRKPSWETLFLPARDAGS
jgi:hypothetical protein